MPQAMDPEDVLSFWFGELDADGRSDEAHTKRWFTKDEAFDRLLREKFGATHEAVSRGTCESWLDSARGRLAYVIVLDQFSRNMFRGSGESFAMDSRAREVVREGVRLGTDKQLAFEERGFFYMPLVHSESIDDQDECVAAFSGFQQEVDEKLAKRLDNSLKFVHMHRDIILRFGRFPHRNALLGRESTPEEIEFLKQPGSGF